MRHLFENVLLSSTWIQVLIVFLAFAVLCPSASISRTWYVNVNGTGDAKDIETAVEDSAVAGDTVVVQSGTYFIENSIQMKDGLVLTSSEGPFATRLRPQMYPPVVIACEGFKAPHTEVSGFWFDGFLATASGLGVIWINGCRNVYIRDNVFTNNQDALVMSDASGPGWVYIENNTMMNNRGLGFWGGDSGWLTFNIIWDRARSVNLMYFAGGNDFLVLDDAGGFIGSNFSADPQFCGPGAGNLFLQSDSPCAPGNSPFPEVGLIGALPVLCGTVKTESKTWGSIKEIYQE